MQPELQPVQNNYATPISASQGVSSGHRVLRNTYMLLAMTMVPTVIGAFLGVNTNFSFMAQHPVVGPLAMFAVMMGMLFGVTALRNSVWGIGLLFAFTFIVGWWMGPMLQTALSFRNGAQIIGLAAGSTAAVFFVMAGIATVSKRDFSFLGKFLFVGLVMLVLASLANLFFQIPALALTISAIGAVVFSLYILYDVQQVVNGGETNYVMATTHIYLDIWNLFMSLLNILMAISGQRD